MAKKRRGIREEDDSKDRDDLIEAGKRLRMAKAREAQEQSGLGVGTEKKAFDGKKPGKPV